MVCLPNAVYLRFQCYVIFNVVLLCIIPMSIANVIFCGLLQILFYVIFIFLLHLLIVFDVLSTIICIIISFLLCSYSAKFESGSLSWLFRGFSKGCSDWRIVG